MIGRVEEVNTSKSGKALRVKLGGKWYGAFLDSGLDAVVGKMIDAQIVPNAKYGDGIGQWGMAPDAAEAVRATAERATERVAVTMTGDRFYMPFVSNVVAHGIASGAIKTPADINAWAKAAHDVAVALDAL